MKRFDPWTDDPCLALRPDADPLDISKLGACSEVQSLRPRIEAGDSLALFMALARCLMAEIDVPQWVSAPFVDGVKRVVRYEAGAWDDAFGRPRPKGTHLAKERRNADLQTPVFRTVIDVLSEDREQEIGPDLFAEVARHLNIPGVKGTVVAQIYSAAKKRLGYGVSGLRKRPVRRPRR